MRRRSANGYAFAPAPRSSLNQAKPTFAIIADPRNAPDFSRFSLGSEDYPDRSTTIILQIEGFSGRTMTFEGPGIDGARTLAARSLPDDFAERLSANRELFPRGVDLILTAGEELAALPRSIRLISVGG